MYVENSIQQHTMVRERRVGLTYAENRTQIAMRGAGALLCRCAGQMYAHNIAPTVIRHTANRAVSLRYGPAIFQHCLPVLEQIDGAEYNMRQTKS